jgi:hypothetical protein
MIAIAAGNRGCGQRWSKVVKSGQMVVKWWSNGGQIMAKRVREGAAISWCGRGA